MSQSAHPNPLARGTGTVTDASMPAMPKAKLRWAQASRSQLDPAVADHQVDLKPAFEGLQVQRMSFHSRAKPGAGLHDRGAAQMQGMASPSTPLDLSPKPHQ